VQADRSFILLFIAMPECWFDRTFQLGLAADAAPQIVERLRRAPERVADAVDGLPPEVLTRSREGKWSIQENVGHLLDLEALWNQRLDDYQRGATELAPADLANRKTHDARHNDRAISEILDQFTAARAAIVKRLARMTVAELTRTALHPRLRQPMTVVDLAFFVAEHDDHHLRTIAELKSHFGQQ
jgi:uncharacterized damage-inducible protein DinB